jgi:hypothetical protein
VGALVAATMALPRRYLTLLFFVWGAGALPLAVIPFAGTLWVAALALLVSGVLLSTGNVMWSTIMQLRVPDAVRGRVSSIDWFGSLALFPVSVALAGSVTSDHGVELSFLLAGITPAVLAAVFFLGARLHREERQQPLPTVLQREIPASST